MSETMEKVEVLIFRPGSMRAEPATIDLPKQGGVFQDLNERIAPLIGARDRRDRIEHVAVLYRDAPHDMFVSEFSAIKHPRDPEIGPEPVNEAATKIYHEASRRRGDDLSDAPSIHGVAILTLKRVWF